MLVGTRRTRYSKRRMRSHAAVSRSHSDHLDQHVVFHDIGWKDYARLVALRGERPFPKLTFLRGELELMSPGMPHEDD